MCASDVSVCHPVVSNSRTGREDCWVPERDVSDTLKSEWQEGIEGATAVAILDMVQVSVKLCVFCVFATSVCTCTKVPGAL